MKLLRGFLLKPTLNLLGWILRHRNGDSLIIGGPLGWEWQANLDATHHGALAGPANAHRHGDLANVGPDDHHNQLHPTEHQDGGVQEISVAGLSGEPAELTTHKGLPDVHHTKFTITEHDTPTRHPLANLDSAVCSETEADGKITTHKGDAAAHHAKYTDALAKAAAVQAGAITNGVTKAPTHDAVFDVKATADAATTPAEVDAKITTHKNIAAAHHARYTDAEAKAAAVRAGAIVNGETKAPTHDAVYDVKVTADIATTPAEVDAKILTHKNIAAAHHTKYTDVEAVTAAEAAGLALADGKNIKIISALGTDHTWSGLTAVMTAGIALTFRTACYVGSDGKLEKSSGLASTSMPIMCLAVASIAENATGEVLLQGFIRDNTWSWTPGGILYGSTVTGVITQGMPVGSGTQVQVVGIAITADIIYFNPSFELVEIS